jgi:hypothetical protein
VLFPSPELHQVESLNDRGLDAFCPFPRIAPAADLAAALYVSGRLTGSWPS